MSTSTAITFWCDCNSCKGAGIWEVGEENLSASRVWPTLKELGWTQKDGKHYAPEYYHKIPSRGGA